MTLFSVVNINDLDGDGNVLRLVDGLADHASVAFAENVLVVLEVLRSDHGKLLIVVQFCDARRIDEHVDTVRVYCDSVLVSMIAKEKARVSKCLS